MWVAGQLIRREGGRGINFRGTRDVEQCGKRRLFPVDCGREAYRKAAGATWPGQAVILTAHPVVSYPPCIHRDRVVYGL